MVTQEHRAWAERVAEQWSSRAAARRAVGAPVDIVIADVLDSIVARLRAETDMPALAGMVAEHRDPRIEQTTDHSPPIQPFRREGQGPLTDPDTGPLIEIVPSVSGPQLDMFSL